MIGALDQRDIQGMLEIGLANDPGETVRGTQGMRGLKPVKPQDSPPTRSQVISSGAAHGPQPNDDDIVLVWRQGTSEA